MSVVKLDSFESNVRKIVERYMELKHEGEPHLELECRFGKVDGNGNFTSSVDRDQVERFIRVMTASHVMEGSRYWEETHDHFVRSRDPNEVPMRLSSTANANTLLIETSNIRKRRVCLNDCRTNGPMDTRVVLSTENPITEKELKSLQKPYLVFIRHRRTFIYKSTTTGACEWNYSVTKRWSGADLVEATIARESTEPNYELEIELAHCSNNVTVDYLTQSMCGKIQDIHQLL